MAIEYSDVWDWSEVPNGTEVHVNAERSENFRHIYADFAQCYSGGNDNVDIILLSYLKKNIRLIHNVISNDPINLGGGQSQFKTVLTEQSQVRMSNLAAAWVAGAIIELLSRTSPETLNSLPAFGDYVIKRK